MPEASLVAESREKKGKQAAKQLRRNGLIPGILYGPGEKPSMLSINQKELLILLHSFGRNAIVNLRLASNKRKKIKAFFYEIQHDPISGDIIHIDLKHIDLNQKIHLSVPVYLEGVPEGVRNEGGILEHLMHKIEIFCIPADIPERITIDVTNLHLGDAVHVSDIEAANFEILSDMSSTLVHIVTPKVITVEEEEIPEEELEEEVEGPAEPEVIGEEE